MPTAFGTSKKQDYATPWALVEAIENKLGRRFTLDVCATEKSAKVPKFYTEEMDAFKQDWALDASCGKQDGIAWCNPPYADGWPGRFLSRAMAEAEKGLTTAFLLPATKVDQPWWHDLVIPHCAVWDVRGRVDFLDPETGEVPKVWKWSDDATEEMRHSGRIGDPYFGRWVKQSNPQASVIVIVGPDFKPCPPVSLQWK